MAKIAIIDFKNQDMGLKILFPEADYFILEEEFDRRRIYNKYNITPIVHIKDVNVYDYITDEKYDTVFIIAGLYGTLKKYYNKEKTDHFCEKTQKNLIEVTEFINKKNFKHICFFDNYDYDYDPNIVFDSEFIKNKNIIFFKRYYNKEKLYKTNVYPFPFITFGHECNIDIINSLSFSPIKYRRIFFSGSLLIHDDKIYGLYRNRKDIFEKITNKIQIYAIWNVPNDIFMKEMKESKYSLDLLGVGDPNTRTYEILSSGSLKLGQRSNLKWPFEDDFCEETIFDDENDLLEKITQLENDEELYKKCIVKQNEIVEKYMNAEYLKNYIIFINHNNSI